MDNKYNQIKKVVLLAILPLLTGTVDLISAFLFSGVLIFIALIVSLIAFYTKDFFEKKANWILLWGIGFSLANFLYIVLPELFAGISPYINFYILLIGVSPIVYANCKEFKWSKFIKDMALFLVLMLFIGLSIEFLGQGSILTNSLIDNPPLTILAEPSGAFLMTGITAILLETLYKYLQLSKTGIKHINQQEESEVSR